jgi:hypothetical protein
MLHFGVVIGIGAACACLGWFICFFAIYKIVQLCTKSPKNTNNTTCKYILQRPTNFHGATLDNPNKPFPFPLSHISSGNIIDQLITSIVWS